MEVAAALEWECPRLADWRSVPRVWLPCSNGTIMADALFILVLLEAFACLTSAYSVVLIVVFGAPHYRLGEQFGIFGVTAVVLLLTTAIADL